MSKNAIMQKIELQNISHTPLCPISFFCWIPQHALEESSNVIAQGNPISKNTEDQIVKIRIRETIKNSKDHINSCHIRGFKNQQKLTLWMAYLPVRPLHVLLGIQLSHRLDADWLGIEPRSWRAWHLCFRIQRHKGWDKAPYTSYEPCPLGWPCRNWGSSRDENDYHKAVFVWEQFH